MDWYKHMTNSHDDPDISDAMDEFGDFGYSGFFILLDIYGQEFSHVNGDGFLQVSKAFLKRKLRKSWGKVELLLNFFSKKISKPRFVWIDNGNYILFQVPKFIELASNWTGRKKRKHLRSTSAVPTAIEEDIDKEDKEEIGDKLLGTCPSQSDLNNKQKRIAHFEDNALFVDKQETEPKEPPVEIPKKTRQKKASKKIIYSKSFENFFSLWPIKKNKSDAFASWQAVGQAEICTTSDIIKAAKEQIEAGMLIPGDPLNPCPYASTWLNQHRWEDEIKRVIKIEQQPRQQNSKAPILR